MKNLLSILFVLSSLAVYSQSVSVLKDLKMDISGFIRNDFIFDSRRNVDACDHLFEIFPEKAIYDSNGEDINRQATAQFLNTFSRFGSRISGLQMGQARVSAYAEVDFTGGSLTPALRLRHAYTQFEWERSSLLFGRYWHPAFIEKVYPSVLNENTGVPFQVFNRSPQLRFTHAFTNQLDVILAAIYQFDFSNSGPLGKTYHYQRDAVVPNLHAQIQFHNSHWVTGLAFDWKAIQPLTYTTGTQGTFKTSEKLSTIAAIAYIKYTGQNLEVKAKSMYGQNTCEHLLPGGYAVATVNPETGFQTYTPLNHMYNWINLTYGKAWKAGLFAGYLKNLGTSKNPVGEFYGFAVDADRMYRISGQLIYNYRNFMFGWEPGITAAAYGTIDYSDKGRIKDAEMVTNFRNMMSIAYKF